MREIKVVLLGCGGVGKSALAIRFATGEFVSSYDPTIEDFYRHQVHIDGVGQTTMEILDTAGSEQFVSMRQLYISTGQVFALVYSVDSRQSFDSLHEIYREIVRTRGTSKVPFVVVGSKGDTPHALRQVSVEHVRETVRKRWGLGSRHLPLVIETSAKEDRNVFETFAHMARLSCSQPVKPITEKKRKKRPKRRSTGRLSTAGRSSTLTSVTASSRESKKRFGDMCVIS